MQKKRKSIYVIFHRLCFFLLLSHRALATEETARIQIFPNPGEITPGKTLQLVVFDQSQSLQQKIISFQSTSVEIARVSDQGLVTGGLSAGSTEILATLSSGETLRARIENQGPGKSIFFEAPAHWNDVYLYAWSVNIGSENLFGIWPGVAMKPSTDWGGLWHTLFVPDSISTRYRNSFLIFSNKGLEQTQVQDLAFPIHESTYRNLNGITEEPSSPSPALKGTQVQISGGRLYLSTHSQENLSGALFFPGQILDVQARETAQGERFSHFEGTGSRFLLNAHQTKTQMVVGNGQSHTLFAVFDQASDPFERTRTEYVSLCAGCHAQNGTGLANYPNLKNIASRYTEAQLSAYISNTMPPQAPGLCAEQCAQNLSRFLFQDAFLQPTEACETPDEINYPIASRGLRLLTRTEYENSVRDLLSLDAAYSVQDLLPEDFRIDGFQTDSTAQVSGQALEGYLHAAERAASSFLENRALSRSKNTKDIHLDQVIEQLEPHCIPKMVKSTERLSCFVSDFGLRVFRRPLITQEAETHTELIVQHGMRAYFEYILAAPSFLYRSELGTEILAAETLTNKAIDAPKKFELTPFEKATWLSYTFLATTPDRSLLQAVQDEKLNTPESIAQIARELFQKNQARVAFARFTSGWLAHSATVNANLDPELKEDFKREDLFFVENVIFNEKGGFADLLMSPFTVLNRALALHYGIALPEDKIPVPLSNDLLRTRGTWYKVPTSTQRAGLLGHAQFFAGHSTTTTSHPVKRGLFVREKILCQEFPPPPVGAELKPVLNPDATTREKFEHLHARSDCHSCHQFIDGVGFGLEGFSETGLVRTQEWVPSGALRNINAQGHIGSLFSPDTVLNSDESPVAFSGVPALSALLLSSPNSRSCFARQVYRYAMGKRENSTDTCAVRHFSESFRRHDEETNGSSPPSQESEITELFIQLTQIPNFFLRQ